MSLKVELYRKYKDLGQRSEIKPIYKWPKVNKTQLEEEIKRLEPICPPKYKREMKDEELMSELTDWKDPYIDKNRNV